MKKVLFYVYEMREKPTWLELNLPDLPINVCPTQQAKILSSPN